MPVHRRAASGDDAELHDRHRQEVLHEQPRPQPQQKLFQGRAPQSLAGMRRLKNAPPPQVLEGKRKRHASTWLTEFVKVVLLPAWSRTASTGLGVPIGLVHRAVRCMLMSLMHGAHVPGASALTKSAL